MSIHGRSVITEALADREACECHHSKREVGEEISGGSLWGYAGRLGMPSLEQLTSGHKGLAIKASKHGLVRLDRPLRQIVQAASLSSSQALESQVASRRMTQS